MNVCVCVCVGRGGGGGDDRMIDQVMRELEQYQVSVAAQQRTKWFGKAICRMEALSWQLVDQQYQ